MQLIVRLTELYYEARIRWEIWRLYPGLTREERKGVYEKYQEMADLRVNWKQNQKRRNGE